MMIKKKITIKGDRVQEVGYRLFLLEKAESLTLRGFQGRNVGSHVEFLIEGDREKVANFISFAKANFPDFAKVEEVTEEDFDGEVMPIEGFYRSLSLNQLVKIVDVGLNMLGKQDILINEVRDLRRDLKTYMEERFQRIEAEIARIKEKIGIS